MPAAARAQTYTSSPITTVFYILLENRCWTNGSEDTSPAIFSGSTAAPFLNALATPNSTAPAGSFYAAHGTWPSAQTSYASCYHNVQANSTNTAPNIHPSEPNYVYMEAGSNLSKLDDNDPYGSTNSVLQIAQFLAANPSFTGENISELLQNAGISWTSYTEGTCLLNSGGFDFNAHTTSGGTLTTNVSPLGTRTVPLVSFSGTSTTYTNEYNGTHQYNFAAKHTGQLFFPATNGSTIATANTSTSNLEVAHYEPLESLATDLANNTQAAYCVITPDQYNDAHTALGTSFTYTANAANNFFGTGVTYTAGSDIEQIAQADNFCATIVPEIMASPVYQAGHAAIVIWTDETEGTNSNDMNHTLTEILISPYAKGNAYNSTLNYDHSSDLNTWQKVFGVAGNTPTGFLNFAAVTSNTSTSALAGVGNGHGALGWGIGGVDGYGKLTTCRICSSRTPFPRSFRAWS